MPSFHRLLPGVSALLMLSACDPDVSSTGATSANQASAVPSSGTAGGTTVSVYTNSTGATPPPAADTVNATPSVAGTVAVIPGAKQTITVAFTSADGRQISGLGLSNTTLPADWSGPGDFTCSVTSSGNDCVLTLTYAPTAAETGTLNIGYVYAGDPNAPAVVTLNIPYAATASDNVVATPMPIGQITAASGSGSQAVSVNFTTDDGNAATDLTLVSNLSALPAGWSTSTPGFSCAILSNGSGCQLVLNYAPQKAGSGTVTLNYTYTDHSGTARTGAVNLPYSTAVDGNVVATVSPTGQINAIQKTGSQPVTVTFTTDDGQSAGDLTLFSPLTSLPADWSSSTSDFTCGTISTGSGCQLHLSYAPTTLSSGTVQLEYGYTAASGAFTTGFVNIPYAATTNDNVVATASPIGPIAAIVGETNPNVAVTFTTDDTRTATALQLTTDLTRLPAGWASTAGSSFSCAGVNGGSTCQLPLTYTPTAAASGTLTLRYTYLDNAGEVKSGSLNIPYRATTDDSIVATPAPPSLVAVAGSSSSLTVSFATDDGNPASALSVTSGLSSLPNGLSSTASGFVCASVSAGTPCQFTLNYAPTAAASGTLTLSYTYLNDSGLAKSGSLNVPFSATTNDNVVATPSPTPVVVSTGTSTTVTVSFATDDGNPASALSVTSGLTALPTGWSGASSFVCSSVSTAGSCQLTLTYQPTSAASGSVALGFSYTNNSGTVKTGTVSIPFSATP
jgi:hypothetical protein